MAKKVGEICYVVADGARARMIRRDGTSGAFHTSTQFHSDDALKRSSELRSDRPGRVVESRSSTRHATEPKHDPQREAKKAFAHEIAERLNEGAARKEFDGLVLVAPPRVLSEVKKHLNTEVQGRIVSELGKDLANTPDADLGKHLDEIAQRARRGLI